MQSPQHQLDLFRQAVAALGGQHAAARYLKVNDRTMGKLCSDIGAPNHTDLHDGHLRDIAAALIEHAELCKRLDRQLSPAFAANLTGHQLARQGKPDARRFDSPPKSGMLSGGILDASGPQENADG